MGILLHGNTKTMPRISKKCKILWRVAHGKKAPSVADKALWPHTAKEGFIHNRITNYM